MYWHGSSASRMLRATKDDVPVCVTVTLLDALVLARSGFDHSIDYRSVMIVGNARAVDDPDEQLESLRIFMERLYPGRWDELRPATRQELKATTVLWTTISEASAKLRTDGPHDEPGDETWPAWAGLIPVQTTLGAPEPDEFVPSGMPSPRVSHAPVLELTAAIVSVSIRRAGESRGHEPGAPADRAVPPRPRRPGAIRAELLARWVDDLHIEPDDIVRDVVLVAESQTRAIAGFARVSARADHSQLKDLWVEPACMGTGVRAGALGRRGRRRPDDAVRRAALRRGPQCGSRSTSAWAPGASARSSRRS